MKNEFQISGQWAHRFLDLSIAIPSGILFFIPFVMISILIKITSKGPIIHWSKRVGHSNTLFLMPKFRTMSINTPQVATHLLQGQNYLTPIGGLLRKTSLDELPQIYSVIVGDMSIVGPRPALFNQDDLIQLRTEKGVHLLTPGITGYAQINGRDEISIPEKVNYDAWYLKHRSVSLDLKIIFQTFFKVILRKGIQH